MQRLLLVSLPVIPVVWGYFFVGYSKELLIVLAPYIGFAVMAGAALSLATVLVAEKGEQLYNWLKQNDKLPHFIRKRQTSDAAADS